MSLRVRLVAKGFEVPLVVEREVAQGAIPACHVRVRLAASGVCHRDLIDRQGRIPYLSLPVTPGHEGVGRVDAVGPGLDPSLVGQRLATLHRDACGECPRCLEGNTSFCAQAAHVFGLTADGTYATFITAPRSAFYAVTLDEAVLDDATAACLACTFGTAYRNLVTRGGLKVGESVLITGANGGVGVAAIQIAHRHGARVTAAVRETRHVEALKALGADEVVVAPDGRVHDHCGGFDLVLENVGASVFPHALRCLRLGGRLASVGNIDPTRVPLNLGQLIVFGQTVFGAGGATPDDMASVLALHGQRPFVLPIAGRMRLFQAEDAHRLLAQGGLFGRIVMSPDPDTEVSP